MGTETNVETLQIGEALDSSAVTVGHAQMFFFSAATYNGHRIHYDKTWTTEVEGHPDLLIQGPLQASLMAKFLTDWMPPRGQLTRFSFQNRASAYAGETLRFFATVTDKRQQDGAVEVDLEFRVENEKAEVLMPGTATITIADPTA